MIDINFNEDAVILLGMEFLCWLSKETQESQFWSTRGIWRGVRIPFCILILDLILSHNGYFELL